MKTKHFFVPALDIGDLLPFVVGKKRVIADQFVEQERAKDELIKFVALLEKNYKQAIHYVGMDVIGEKNYERFLFAKGGFLEILTDSPAAINAHFPDNKTASLFRKALVATLKKLLAGSQAKLFIDSIVVQDQDDTSLTVSEWHLMKNIRSSVK